MRKAKGIIKGQSNCRLVNEESGVLKYLFAEEGITESANRTVTKRIEIGSATKRSSRDCSVELEFVGV